MQKERKVGDIVYTIKYGQLPIIGFKEIGSLRGDDIDVVPYVEYDGKIYAFLECGATIEIY